MKKLQPHGPVHMTHRQATPRQQSAARPPPPQSVPSPRPPPSTPVSSPAAGADLHPASRGGAGVLLLPPHSLTGEHPNPSHPASASNFVSSPAACADPHPASRGGARRPPSSFHRIVARRWASLPTHTSSAILRYPSKKFRGSTETGLDLPLPSSTYFQLVNFDFCF